MNKCIFVCLMISYCTWSSAQVTILLEGIPKNTPETTSIYIAGDFQNWDPGSEAHRLVYNKESNNYFITLPTELEKIQFKITRGEWESVESDASGNDIANRVYQAEDGDTLKIHIQSWKDLTSKGALENSISTAAENVHILTDSFFMPALNRHRRIWIYLPPNYIESNHRYPVLYMHDGQNIFDSKTSYAGEWSVDETLNKIYEKEVDGVIVVGIDNGEKWRSNEYAPWVNKKEKEGGAGDKYADFIVHELKPYIDSNYRTLSEREHTGIMGSSLGALISMYTAMKYQDVFSKVGAFSSAYWFNPEIYNFVKYQKKLYPMRFYQNVGLLEGKDMIRGMQKMEKALQKAGFEKGEINSMLHEDGNHSEWYWEREFEEAFLWLFEINMEFENDE